MLIREVRSGDVPVIDRLLRAAYGQPESYVTRLEAQIRQSNIRTFVAVLEGRPAGVVFGNDYGTTAYVSLMAVDPSLQRRGIAKALMRALCAWCDERGFGDVQLDATPSGAPLYEQFGFVDDGETVVMIGRGTTTAEPSVRVVSSPDDRAALLALDREAFGGDRTPMLERWLDDRGNVALVRGTPADGYVIVHGETLGPWIARNRDTGAALFTAARALRGDDIARLCLVSRAPDAASIAGDAGFVRQRALRHMLRGRRRPTSPALYARSNLGQG